MNAEIRYNGLTSVPSDHESPDGDLAAALNLIPEDGAVVPVLPPGTVCGIGTGKKAFIHKIGEDSNYLTYTADPATLQWIGHRKDGTLTLFDTPAAIQFPSDAGTIRHIAAIGYIIILSTSANLYYIRYDAKKNAYVCLGSKIPDINLDLALKLNFTVTDTQETAFEVKPSENSRPSTADDEWQLAIAVPYSVSAADDANEDGVFAGGYATKPIGFDTAFKLLANVEYRLKWDAVSGPSNDEDYGIDNLNPPPYAFIEILGYRNGSDKRENICWVEGGAFTSAIFSVEKKLVLEDEWTNISFVLHLIAGEEPYNVLSTGNVSWYKGIDNSETGADKVSSVIEYNTESYNALMANVNKFIKEQVTDKTRFIYPFFARYAVRLYDGSYSFISEPALMLPNSGYVPAVAYSKHSKSGTRLLISAFAADLTYSLRTAIPTEWEDLILGVDIFASAPIWAYNQAQEYDGSKNYFRFRTSADSLGYGRAFLDGVAADGDSYSQLQLRDYIRRYASSVRSDYVEVAPREEKDIKKDFISVANFYKVASLGLSDLKEAAAGFMDLELEAGNLSALVTRETLSDDTLQYIGFRNAYVKDYNRRLHVCNSSVILRSPAHPDRCFNYLTSDGGMLEHIVTYVFLATDDGKKIVRSDNGSNHCGPWFFYPDSRAYKAAFVRYHGRFVNGIAEIDLKRHDFLNGAYWMADSLTDSPVFRQESADPYAGTVEDSVHAPSMIYVSETNCPLVFKAVSAVSIGAQEVFAVSSAAKALSQGQFGQFPLYAFTDEGVWALEVSGTGSYSARQPITRDVCVNPESITQIDSAVLFATDRGIMMISGSQTQCISDTINSDTPFDVRQLPKLHTLCTMAGYDAATCLPVVALRQFLRRSSMLYDYVHQRIIVFNPGYSYAYVYSLSSGKWGMMYSELKTAVNSYPEALAIDHEGRLLDFSKTAVFTDPANAPSVSALLVTRPLKLDAPDVLKTVSNVIQRGHFRRGHVQSVLYATRDLFNWHLVWSSRDHYMRGFSGTPYKYYRIALLCVLSPDETIRGASLRFIPRQNNQPR